MAHFEAVWDFLSLKGQRREWRARVELFSACFGLPLLHSDQVQAKWRGNRK